MKTKFIFCLLVAATLILTLSACEAPSTGKNNGNSESIFTLDLGAFKNSADEDVKAAFENVNSVKLRNETNYIIEVSGRGYDSDLIVEVTIGQDGKVVDAVTLRHNEVLGEEYLAEDKYNLSFIGKTQDEARDIDTVSGATMTTMGFKRAVLTALEVYEIITK